MGCGASHQVRGVHFERIQSYFNPSCTLTFDAATYALLCQQEVQEDEKTGVSFAKDECQYAIIPAETNQTPEFVQKREKHYSNEFAKMQM
eukprot:3825779-Pyramimonas_sp.AAC.2